MGLNDLTLLFVCLTETSVHGFKLMEEIPAKSSAYYLMDKGYVKFNSLYSPFHINHECFASRAKDNMINDIIGSKASVNMAGLISDRMIKFTGYHTAKHYADSLRIIVYEDDRDGKVYQVLTNNLSIDALTFAELYRERWQIELFFKLIKQYLHIRTFYDTSKNIV